MRKWNTTGLYKGQRDRLPAQGDRRRRAAVRTSEDITCAGCGRWVHTRDGAVCRYCQKPIAAAGGAS
jgi:hypothetical protein